MTDKFEFFSEEELICRCGCGLGQNDMDEAFMAHLIAMRREWAHPIIVTSAIRCPAHNRAVGGAKSSAHLEGCAVDIAIFGNQAKDLLKLIMNFDFKGVLLRQHGPMNSRIIHIDDSKLLGSRLFTYP